MAPTGFGHACSKSGRAISGSRGMEAVRRAPFRRAHQLLTELYSYLPRRPAALLRLPQHHVHFHSMAELDTLGQTAETCGRRDVRA